MNLKHFDSVKDLPPDVRKIAYAHLNAIEHVIAFLERAKVCSFQKGTCCVRREWRHDAALERDGEPRRIVKWDGTFIWDFKHPAHVFAGGDRHAWSHGSLCYAVALHFNYELVAEYESVDIESDDAHENYKTTSTYTEFAVGKWPDKKQVRIAYRSGHRATGSDNVPLNLHEWDVARVVLEVRETIERLDALALVTSDHALARALKFERGAPPKSDEKPSPAEALGLTKEDDLSIALKAQEEAVTQAANLLTEIADDINDLSDRELAREVRRAIAARKRADEKVLRLLAERKGG